MVVTKTKKKANVTSKKQVSVLANRCLVPNKHRLTLAGPWRAGIFLALQ